MTPLMEKLPFGAGGALAPYYQPVVSVADGRIFGYEVLGRQFNGDEVRGLGEFFNSPAVSNDEKIAIDRQIRSLAFRRFKQEGRTERLFVNIHPNWIYQYHDRDEVFPTIRLAEEAGLAPEQLVIEITEEEFQHEDLNFLNRLADRYRDRGIKIAIDDFSYPNFDRLISIKPDFVKIDIRLIRKSVESAEYRKLIRYISDFSQELGINVIFEGVETLFELENSIEAGGAYIQGYFFSQPAKDFQDPLAHADRVRLGLNNVIYRSMLNSRNVLKIEESMNRYLALVIEREQLFQRSNLDDALSRILDFLPPQCFRVFICDGYGVQRSSNFTKNAQGKFQIFPEHRGKNWGWRPYFFHNVVRMQEFNRGVISHRYVDVETRQHTHTFSYPLGQDLFIFIDFSAEFS